jgi:hypothetical protein
MSAALRSLVVRTIGWSFIASVWAVLGAAVYFGVFFLILAYPAFDAFVGTEYAPGYSEEAFDGISIGEDRGRPRTPRRAARAHLRYVVLLA